MLDRVKQTGSEWNVGTDVLKSRADYLLNGIGTPEQKVESLMRFMSRQELAKLLCYVDIFRETSGVTGSIVECGVYFGNGLMTWAKLAAALEPFNYSCRVLGFDTFEGNVGLSGKDSGAAKGAHSADGGYLAEGSEGDMRSAIKLLDADRPIAHIPKVELIKGDLRKTAPAYIEKHQGTIVRILSLTVNLYEPTKAALATFVPRMPKGAAIVPFTLNSDIYPGMTLAVLDELGIKGYSLRTPAHYPNVNYIVL